MRNLVVGLFSLVVFILLSGSSLVDLYSYEGAIMILGVMLIALAQRLQKSNAAR